MIIRIILPAIKHSILSRGATPAFNAGVVNHITVSYEE